jgi:hypothetical protein
MVQRHGPQLRNLMYDKAFEAAGVMRSEVADPIKARSMIAPPTGRIDSCIQAAKRQQITLQRRASIDCRRGSTTAHRRKRRRR